MSYKSFDEAREYSCFLLLRRVDKFSKLYQNELREINFTQSETCFRERTACGIEAYSTLIRIQCTHEKYDS